MKYRFGERLGRLGAFMIFLNFAHFGLGLGYMMSKVHMDGQYGTKSLNSLTIGGAVTSFLTFFWHLFSLCLTGSHVPPVPVSVLNALFSGGNIAVGSIIASQTFDKQSCQAKLTNPNLKAGEKSKASEICNEDFDLGVASTVFSALLALYAVYTTICKLRLQHEKSKLPSQEQVESV